MLDLAHRTGEAVRASVSKSVLLRHQVAASLQRIVIVYLCVLALALGLEFSRTWNQLMSATEHADAWRTAFVFLREAWLMCAIGTSQFLGIVVFLGALWWETQKNRSGMRVVVWACGQSPPRSLITAVVLGLLLGPVQTVFDTRLGPAAAFVQTRTGMGTVGRWFDRRLSNRVTWAAVGDDILSARIDYGPPAVLYDLSLYSFSRDGRLEEIVTAKSARRSQTSGIWRLEGGSRARAPNRVSREVSALSRVGPSSGAKSDSELLYLALEPAILRYHDIPAEVIAPGMLRTLLKRSEQPHMLDDYATWLYHNPSRALYPGLMAALAASVAPFAIGRVTPLMAYVLMLAAGYMGHVWMKMSVVLGEQGFLPPLVAGWSGIALIAALVALLQARLCWRPVQA